MPIQRSKLGGHPVALLLYTALSLGLTWPLIAHINTHVPGDGIDDPALAWNLWWIKERLIDQLILDIFHADWMFYPIEINLGFYTLTPLNGLLSVPLQVGANLTLASNIVLLSSFILSGYGAFLLAKYVLDPHDKTTYLAALFAGIIYAFASSKLFYASLGQFNIASSQWVPFCALFVLRTGQLRPTLKTWRNPLLAGLFLAFQTWSELTYASFLLIFIAGFFVWTAVGHTINRLGQGPVPTVPSWWAHISGLTARFIVMGIVFAIGVSPFLWAMLPDMGIEGDFFASGGGFSDIFSADLLGYLLPTRLHPIFGQRIAAYPFSNDKAQHIYIGYSLLSLWIIGILSFLQGRDKTNIRHFGFWLVAGLFFWALTLGPTVRWAGENSGIPGPFDLISRLPFFSGNRYPSRYSIMLLLCVAMLGATGLQRLSRGNRARLPLFLLFSGFFLFEHLSVPLPINDFQIPPIYRIIAQTPGDFTVLELPTGWRNGARVLGKSDLLIMMQQWYQTQHGKRRLGGNTSRNPRYKFQYFTEAPLIGELIALMNADRDHLSGPVAQEFDDMVARVQPVAADILNFLNVRFITLHVERSPAELIRFVEQALPVNLVDEWQGSDWLGQPSVIRLYAVVPTGQAENGWQIDLPSESGKLHLGEGWASISDPERGVRYAEREKPILLLDIPERGGNVWIQVWGAENLAGLSLNDYDLIWIEGGRQSGLSTLQTLIPPQIANEPIDRLQLSFAANAPSALQREFEQASAPVEIGQTGATLNPAASIVVISAGEEVGSFADIFVNGKTIYDAARPSRRGYNLVALSPEGAILDQQSFDTHDPAQNPTASLDLADWLNTWPIGTIVAGAVNDEASYRLAPEAVAALARIGVDADLRHRFRWSHGFVGVSGAEPGQALEQISVLRPASVHLGPPRTGDVFGGVAHLLFEPAP